MGAGHDDPAALDAKVLIMFAWAGLSRFDVTLTVF